jgi:hypothetical protein
MVAGSVNFEYLDPTTIANSPTGEIPGTRSPCDIDNISIFTDFSNKYIRNSNPFK